MQKAIACHYTISPLPVNSWDIPVDGLFCVRANGFNPKTDRFEIWQRIRKSKAQLITHPEKPIESIPKIIGGLSGVVFPVLEEWKIEEWKITELHPDKGFVND